MRHLPWPGGAVAAPRAYFKVTHLDAALVLCLLAIIAFGLVILLRTPDAFLGQLLRVGAALVVMVAAAHLHPRSYLRLAPYIYLGCLALLVLVPFFGVVVNGSRRWLELPGGFRFQPSELMKVAMPLVVGWYLTHRRLPPRLIHVLGCLAIVAVPAALIAAQPDLGTTALFTATGLALIVLSGLRWRWVCAAAAAAAAAAPALWSVMHEYQRDRVRTLFDPERDPTGAGWNIIQSKTAIGSGGVFGKGLDQGTQSRLDFLPEANTDFVSAVIGEELGLVGITLLLLLYVFVLARGLYIATTAGDTFGRMVASGVTLTFFLYVFVNIAMVCGLLPVVGAPLPLVSYGGTSAISILLGFGIVMSIQTHRNW